MFEEVLRTAGTSHRCLQTLSQSENFAMRLLTARATIDNNLFAVVECLRDLLQLGVGWTHHRLGTVDGEIGFIGGCRLRHVDGNDQNRYAAFR